MRSGVPKIVRAVAAATLVLTAGAHGWLVNSARELHAGLLSFDSGGERWSNADLVAAARDNGSQHVSAVYPVAGHVLFGLAVLAAALLVVAAFTAARWQRHVAARCLERERRRPDERQRDGELDDPLLVVVSRIGERAFAEAGLRAHVGERRRDLAGAVDVP